MNDLDLCLEVVSRSRQPLRYIRRWISRKPLEIEAWFQWTTNRVSNSHVTDDITWPQRCCEAVRSAILATAWLLVIVCVCENQWHIRRWLLWTLGCMYNLHIVYFCHTMKSTYGKITCACRTVRTVAPCMTTRRRRRLQYRLWLSNSQWKMNTDYLTLSLVLGAF